VSLGLIFNQPTHKKISCQKIKILSNHAMKSVVVFLCNKKFTPSSELHPSPQIEEQSAAKVEAIYQR
jgi:hypothetical protein